VDVKDLQTLVVREPFKFTKGCPTLQIDMSSHNSPFSNMYKYGSLLYDLENAPGQLSPITDTATELRLINRMIALMKENDAPAEQYTRLGLREGMHEAELQCQHDKFREGQQP